ncbi:hypothetical protein [uncultured Methanobrevibacter sp.]|uniref:hypothetical protein n=1 Tax=uncultured Methanobrevibacter sp. TaxID=253161 RepID=UPI00263808F1|nr:hypothetical protein [uncultured Methanobrevibacter sp.]
MDEKKVNLEKSFAKKLGMGTTAKRIFQDLDDELNVLILNFKDVEFISRLFAQEYVYQKNNSHVSIKEENMSEFIKELLNVVEEDYIETYGVKNI